MLGSPVLGTLLNKHFFELLLLQTVAKLHDVRADEGLNLNGLRGPRQKAHSQIPDSRHT